MSMPTMGLRVPPREAIENALTEAGFSARGQARQIYPQDLGQFTAISKQPMKALKDWD
jgi:hypothetical protein